MEHDSLGEVRVPSEHLWGAQTQRSLENFPIGRERFVWGRPLIRAFGLLKFAAARANCDLGVLDAERARLICAAAKEVADGAHDAEFPLVAFQTGSGTQTNMNANEVIANRANELAGRPRGSEEPVHPNDHVNRSQSSNDTFPTAMYVAVVEGLHQHLYPALKELLGIFDAKAADFAEIIMAGRTHLEDATPVSLGQVISGWAAQIRGAVLALKDAEVEARKLAIGGTAVGTGLNSPAGFGPAVARIISAQTGIEFAQADNLFAALSAHDELVEVSAALRTLAGALLKIANDVRWYASGPRAGIGEISIPANEPGSSIMPGKVNPTQAEALSMVCIKVFGNDASVAFAGSQGNFQLNVYKPIIAWSVLESIGLLSDAVQSFARRCARGIMPRERVIDEHLHNDLMLVTALSPHIGYEKSAKIAQRAQGERLSLREAALAEGIAPADFDRWVDPHRMI